MQAERAVGVGRRASRRARNRVSLPAWSLRRWLVALIGGSGTLSYWAPLQPVLALLSIALLCTGVVPVYSRRHDARNHRTKHTSLSQAR